MIITEDLELKGNNLYRNGRVIQFDDGDQILVRDKVITEGTVEDKYHTVIEGDRLDTLAWRYYNEVVEDSSKYWWVIADANQIMNPMDLSEWVGREILVPNLFNFLLMLP